jgi:hypothetical protein
MRFGTCDGDRGAFSMAHTHTTRHVIYPLLLHGGGLPDVFLAYTTTLHSHHHRHHHRGAGLPRAQSTGQGKKGKSTIHATPSAVISPGRAGWPCGDGSVQRATPPCFYAT